MNPLQREQPVILVVDDEQSVLDELASVLAESGFACHCCTTVEAAVATAGELRPDLIVSDTHLHGGNGMQLCEHVRHNKKLADIPMMYLSRTQIPDIIHRSDGLHGTYFLRKPFDTQVLVTLIDTALSALSPRP